MIDSVTSRTLPNCDTSSPVAAEKRSHSEHDSTEIHWLKDTG